MLMVALILLLGTAWSLWNLYGQVKRFNALVDRCAEVLQQLQPEEGDSGGAGATEGDDPSTRGAAEQAPIRVVIEINDADALARRYSTMAGMVGTVAPNVLKQAVHAKVLEQTTQAVTDSGHDAEIKVLVL